MTDYLQYRDPFGRLLGVLKPWLDQVVVIGGWAHQLYRLHPDAQELDYPPLMTLDTDVAVPAQLLPSESDIRVGLLAEGFTEELLGEDRPPATHYHFGDQTSGFYAEFLTPLVGSGRDRNQRRRGTTKIAGVVSQRLRHIDLLLFQPWTIDFEAERFSGQVQIANPVSFLAQKILIHRRRDRQDRAKDILYMHDTLEVFGARLQALGTLWQSKVAEQLNTRTLSAVSNASQDLFGVLSDDIRRSAEISAERALSPETIRNACQYGFIKIFGQAKPRGL